MFKCLYSLKCILQDCLRRNNAQICNKSTVPSLKTVSYNTGNLVEIGNRSHTVTSKALFHGAKGSLIIHDNCTIKDTIFWFEGNGGIIEIGDNVTIESAQLSVVDNKMIKIGKDCMLSSGISMVTTDSHSILNLNGERINPDANIELRPHVWIGANVRILKGVTINSNSIVGAESLVTKDVPAGCIAAGIPAKIIKENINWDRKRI